MNTSSSSLELADSRQYHCGVVFGLVVGRVLDHGLGDGPVFGLVSTFQLIVILVILMTVRVAQPIEFRS